MQRGIPAIKRYVQEHSFDYAVVLMDGARVNKKLPEDAINPSEMNLSDGGKNRLNMRLVGFRGMESVLTSLGRWPDGGLRVADARALLWEWDKVREQLTQVEQLYLEHGILLIYNPKAHPWFKPIEKFWRWAKYRLENIFNLNEIKVRYKELLESMMSPDLENQRRLDKWFDLARKYIEFDVRGGNGFVREAAMKALDLDTVGPRPIIHPPANLTTEQRRVHDSNWVLIRGKHWPANSQPWSANLR